MGQFASMLFSALLGWVQTAASWLWGLLTNADGNAWLKWLMDHWLLLAIILCLGGLVIDFVVYLIRWQPYRVWRSFLSRFSCKDDVEETEEPAQPVFQRKWLYADGSTSVEDVHEPLQEQPVHQSEKLDVPVRPHRRMARRTTPEQAYHQPVYPPQWQHNQQGENE